jgi:hypothetical protein
MRIMKINTARKVIYFSRRGENNEKRKPAEKKATMAKELNNM